MIIICGGAPKLSKRKPKNWIDIGYKIIVPYPFKWRSKLGKMVCDCKEVIEVYQPYYGFTIYHKKTCAIMKHYEKYPQMDNLLDDSVSIEIIARSE